MTRMQIVHMIHCVSFLDAASRYCDHSTRGVSFLNKERWTQLLAREVEPSLRSGVVYQVRSTLYWILNFSFEKTGNDS